MLTTTPTVSVVMSVFNGERFLREALDSIVEQHYRDFEFIVIDDGSTDSTSKILHNYAGADPRIRAYRQDNQGIVASLNRGCALARGRYIARMDADDISEPIRLERQVSILDQNPDIGLVGAGMYSNIDASGSVLYTSYLPEDDGSLQKALVERWCFLHPSIMFRRDIYERVGGYRKEFEGAEDHDLILRMLEHTQAYNVPELLIRYRLNPSGLSVTYHQYINELGEVAMRLARRRRKGLPEDLAAELPTLVQLRARRGGPGGLSGVIQRHRDSFYAANRYYGFGCRELCSARLDNASRCFRRSLETNALFVKSWIGLALCLVPILARALRPMFRTSMQECQEATQSGIAA